MFLYGYGMPDTRFTRNCAPCWARPQQVGNVCASECNIQQRRRTDAQVLYMGPSLFPHCQALQTCRRYRGRDAWFWCHAPHRMPI